MSNNLCEDCGFQLQPNFRFCPGCGKSLQKLGKCPKCGYDNEPNAHFCQNCGSQLQKIKLSIAEQERTIKDIETTPIPEKGITIEFPFSSSQTFEFAVEEARKHSSFMQLGEGKKAIYRITYNQEEMEAATKLAEQMKGWRSRTIYIDGTKATWDSVFSFLWCYQKKQASYKPEFYCFGYENEWQYNIWGCIQSQLAFRNEEWFCWGKFIDNKGTWQFDRDRIHHELEKNLYPYRFCPAFDQSRLEEIFNAFPNEVNPNKDKDWKFVESWDEEAPGIVVTIKRYGFNEQVILRGVCPKGFGALKEINKNLKFKLPGGFK